jgi:hypothetical protein
MPKPPSDGASFAQSRQLLCAYFLVALTSVQGGGDGVIITAIVSDYVT